MTGLLELREKLKTFYSKGEIYIIPLVKFLLAFIVLNAINGYLGYMLRIDSWAIVMIVALLCSFLPNGTLVFFAALFSMLHIYELSLEVAAVSLGVFLIVFLMFGRFSSKESVVMVITPLTCGLGIPYVMPVVMGLLGTPASAVSVGCGIVIYYLLETVVSNATTINAMGEDEVMAKIRLVIDGLLNNKAMLVLIVASAITVVVVYLLRRLAVQHAWTIAITAGVMVELVVLLVGDLLYDTNISVAGAVVGVILTVLISKVIEFFRFCVDYSRTEKVQFEDDEYYYYVTAIPKMTVAAPTNTVKRINTQSVVSRSAGDEESARRRVATEHTSNTRNDARREQTALNRKSVTINGNMTDEADYDEIDYEDLF